MECQVEIDDKLLEIALELSGLTDVSYVANEALRALVQKHDACEARNLKKLDAK